MAIEASRQILPLIEAELGPDAVQVREALSQLQMAFAQAAPSAQTGSAADSQQPPQPGGPAPAPAASRLWVPGQ
jgi:hypothetical protein